MEIRTTTNYDQFKTLKGNRQVIRRHVVRLGGVIAESPETIQFTPILVNDRNEVIDGQHRLEALKELGLPVHYVIMPKGDIADVQRLNSTARPWTPMDYARSFANAGKPQYGQYIQLRERYGLNHFQTLLYAGQSSVKHTFRHGKLPQFDGRQAVFSIERLFEVGEFYPGFKSAAFTSSFYAMMKHPDYDHERMVQQMEKAGYMLPKKALREDMLRAMEQVYNFNKEAKNRVRFDYTDFEN